MILLLVSALGVFAQENKRGWQVELKRLSLDINSTDVKNATLYQNFPNSKLSADSQRLVQGFFNMDGNFFAEHYVWTNNLLMEYGRSTIIPTVGERLTSESSDRAILTTAYNLKLWNIENFLGGFSAGPYSSLAYQTEFRATPGAPRKQVIRGAVGAKLFEGKYLKSFYVAGFAEDDFTYSPSTYKYGWETGFSVEQPLREGVKFVYSGLFRNYLYETNKLATNIDYEAELDARMEVEVYKKLVIAPFINFYTAQASAFAARGQNIYVGVSLSFSHLFAEAEEIK